MNICGATPRPDSDPPLYFVVCDPPFWRTESEENAVLLVGMCGGVITVVQDATTRNVGEQYITRVINVSRGSDATIVVGATVPEISWAQRVRYVDDTCVVVPLPVLASRSARYLTVLSSIETGKIRVSGLPAVEKEISFAEEHLGELKLGLTRMDALYLAAAYAESRGTSYKSTRIRTL